MRSQKPKEQKTFFSTNRFLRTFLVPGGVGLGLILGACSKKSGASEEILEDLQGLNSSALCADSDTHSIKILNENGEILENLILQNPAELTVELARFNSCDQLIEKIPASSWNLNGAPIGYLIESSGPQTNLILNKSSTHPSHPGLLTAVYGDFSTDLTIRVSRLENQIPNLFRWFHADSLSELSEDSLIGQPSSPSVVPDLSLHASAFDGVTVGSRHPKLKKTIFSKPVFEFCGKNAGCPGISQNQQLRTATSYAAFSGKDFTMFFVVARASANKNFIFSNQSSGNNTGVFFGWTSNTTLRFSLAGPSGSPSVTATVSPYSGSPNLEIYTLRLDTQTSSSEAGMSLSRNGVLIANNSGVSSQQASASTIPYLGTQRSDNDNSHFYLGEFLVYERALSSNETCLITEKLGQKYGLSTLACP